MLTELLCAVEFIAADVCHRVDILLSKHYSQSVPTPLLVFLVKMVINQSYLFVLLLVSLSASCNSNCPTTAPATFNQSVQIPYQECAKLYAMLETALLENPGNLYQLYDCFFPSSSSEPIYALFSFKLNKWHDICWTSSVLLRHVGPSVLSSLQLQLINLLLLPDTAGQRVDCDARLSIKPENFTESDYLHYNTTIDAVLQDFTSSVSTYCR